MHFNEGLPGYISPAEQLNQALQAASQGNMPGFTTEALLTTLHLDRDEPDGLSLMERLAGEQPNFHTMRQIPKLWMGASYLIQSTNEHTANEAQEAVAATLGKVVARQVVREGDICPRCPRDRT